MMRLTMLCAFLMSACAIDQVEETGEYTDDLDSSDGATGKEPKDAMVHHAKGFARPTGGGHKSPNLTWHGGPIMNNGAAVQPIFWGAKWATPSFVGDKITGIQSFYGGMGGTSYDGTNSEYTDGSGRHVDTGVTVGASHTDTSTSTGGATTAPILAEVCRQISNPVANGYYPVYTDQRRGNAGYCAWHSAGSCNGVQIQFAFFWDLDGDTGCDPGASGGHSQGLSAIANVSGHELSEALTDPQLNAWYDSAVSENSDKCAWKFGTNLISFANGSQWRIQGNWSNAAYNAGQGYGGNVGCIDGAN